MSVETETNTGLVNKTSGQIHAEIANKATISLLDDCQENGVATTLDIPVVEPGALELHRTSWTRGTKIDEYSYIAGKIIDGLAQRMPDSTDEAEIAAAGNLVGFYGQLGASILLRCIQKGTQTYLEQAYDPSLDECTDIMQNSYRYLIHPLANWHNSIGSRLEVLYDLTSRGDDIYRDYALAVTSRYGFRLQAEPLPHLELDDYNYALFSAEQYPELEPSIPRKPVGICPIESQAHRIKSEDLNKVTQITVLQGLWSIAINSCRDIPWIWPKQFSFNVDQPQERS